MSFNYGREEKKWRLWKEAEEKELRGFFGCKLVLCSHRLTPPYRPKSLFLCFLSYSPHRSAISEYIFSLISRS